MKRVGAVITFFVLLFAFAKWGPAINFATTTQSKGEPLVVSGEGKVSVTPDIAKVTIGIEENGNNLKQVQDNVNKKSKILTDTLKKLGVADSDIKTTSYNVYPQYDYASRVQSITGYQVAIDYQVTIKDFDKINSVIVAATNSGANTVGGINFEVNDSVQKQKLQEARELAVKEAKEKAEGLAKSAGITLGKIINVSETQNNVSPRPFALPVAGGGDMQKAITQPDIQAGQTELDVIVSLSYEVR